MFPDRQTADIDPRLEQALRYALAIAAALVLTWPGARGQSAIGWLPLWLLGLPLTAWWALHRFALPGLSRLWPAAPARAAQRRRPVAPQARRRNRAVGRGPRARAA